MKAEKKAFNKLMEDFHSLELLDTIDNLDEIRSIIGDRAINRPPEIRDKLLKLHTMIMDEAITSEGETIWELAGDIEDEIYTVYENIEKMLETLEKITDSAPDEFEEED
jgi:hypothetical protein